MNVLEGITRVLALSTTSSGAGATRVNLRPTQGCVWKVIHAHGMQDDGVRNQYWRFTDPDTALQRIAGYSAGAAWERFPIFACNASVQSPPVEPVICTYDRYLTYEFDASAASKVGWIEALVVEYRGVAVEA